ncbi:MAG: hypothetical protein GVY10_00855 [Verrucomicrobia bacterium]|jgi:hypothetical protein|nr:hypothetical protein [Verrucomicrobiota bacterium]
MSDPTEPSPPPQERPNHDGRIFGENGEPDVFVPRDRLRKWLFVLFSCFILFVGLWDLWGPLSRWVFGETGEGRVLRIVRESPGEPAENIRVRREIEEGDYSFDTLFRHFVEVVDKQGDLEVFELAVAGRQTPYALINDSFKVIYFPGDDYAYGLWQHRTWAFGCALVLMGLTFVPLSVYLLRMVGRPVVIDPEDPAELEKEREAEARERAGWD